MPAAPKQRKPRNLGLFLLLMAKSKRGGGHVNKRNKRQRSREKKETRDELS